MKNETFTYRFVGRSQDSVIRLANEPCMNPPPGYRTCKARHHGSDHWFPVYIPESRIPAHLLEGAV